MLHAVLGRLTAWGATVQPSNKIHLYRAAEAIRCVTQHPLYADSKKVELQTVTGLAYCIGYVCNRVCRQYATLSMLVFKESKQRKKGVAGFGRRHEQLINGKPGHNANLDGLLVKIPWLLPHVEQFGGRTTKRGKQQEHMLQVWAKGISSLLMGSLDTIRILMDFSWMPHSFSHM